jgi:hypothetical protein
MEKATDRSMTHRTNICIDVKTAFNKADPYEKLEFVDWADLRLDRLWRA